MEDLSRPSGITIPLFLKSKWEKQQQEQRKEDSADIKEESGDEIRGTNDDDALNDVNMGGNDNEKPSTAAVWEPKLRLSLDQELTRDQKNELSNKVFTTSDLEERITRTTAAMFDIQRQLYRGEEIYYEDTYSHGSIYKGWDGFIDSTSIPGAGGTQMSSNRRVPADSRWFSTSCGSVSRMKPPAAFPPPLISQPVLSVAKLESIPEQHQQAGISSKQAPQSLIKASNATAIATTKTTEATESSTETAQPSSTRKRQRIAASAEKSETGGRSSTPKSRSRPTTPIDDSSGMKKKRKMAAAGSSEEPPSKKASSVTKNEAAGAGTPKGNKSDTSTTKGGPRSSKAEKKEGTAPPGTKSKADTSTPSKREKESGETPVPRKRGRPRRKT